MAFDSVILGAYLHPEASDPTPVDRIPERLKNLVETLESASAEIIVPTPALSEFLVLAANEAPAYLEHLSNSSVFKVEPFDLKAAIEAAALQRQAIDAGSKKGRATGPWQKVKVDWQIVAIAKVHDVDELFSDDDDVRKLAESAGVRVKGVEDLPLPSAAQASLFSN